MGNGASTDIEIFAEGELEAELTRLGASGNVGLKKFVVKSYNDVIEGVIRPPRARYAVDALGDAEFPLPTPEEDAGHGTSGGAASTFVRREDFHVHNDRELKVLCSHWRLYEDKTSRVPMVTSCLIYLHSNIGSRVDALRVRDLALQRGFSVLAFDFCGSGQSDGIYVTMGWNEAKDLHFVLQHLEDDVSVRDVCIYAHSMGTFPAIVNVASRTLVVQDKKLRASMETLPAYFRSANVNAMAKPIRGMVLDGGYATMEQLIRELMESVLEEGFHIPSAIMKLACSVIEKSVKKRAEVDLEKLRPIDLVRACSIPALFIAGKSDRYVASHHSDKLAAQYAGPAMTMAVDGEHYTLRERQVYSAAVDFLYGAMRSASMQHR
uniref:Serine aminopeptidase S33 domain-containing protein n=1 Tax=Globisporangium ultimum (strain ATCC 200006 / CBS 805.95 / DAOM BR144) TaxID=431595 RepID=K3WIP9_GLOUD